MEASTARITSSSPPKRARISASRKISLKMEDSSFKARSPWACPWVSLISFRSSKSPKNNNMLLFSRRVRFISCSARRVKPRRLYNPVSSSVSDRLRISCSMRLRSVISFATTMEVFSESREALAEKYTSLPVICREYSPRTTRSFWMDVRIIVRRVSACSLGRISCNVLPSISSGE